MFKKALIIASIVTPVIVASAIAQQAGIKRTPIRTIDYPPGYTTVTAIVELAPGICAGRPRPCRRRRIRSRRRP